MRHDFSFIIGLGLLLFLSGCFSSQSVLNHQAVNEKESHKKQQGTLPLNQSLHVSNIETKASLLHDSSSYWIRFNPCKCSDQNQDLEISKDRLLWERVHWLNGESPQALKLKKFWSQKPYHHFQGLLEFTRVRTPRLRGHRLRQVYIDFDSIQKF